MAYVVPIPATEFDDKFVEMMRNRMLVSYHKYGSAADAYPDKVDAMESLLIRVEQYKKTGNRSALIDLANYAMIEFMYPAHPQAHLETGDLKDPSPGRATRAKGVNVLPNDRLPAPEEV